MERFDLTQLGRESLETGHLLVPTIRALARSCEGSWGSTCTGVTTQDILDTGLMLQVKEAWGHALGLLHSIRGHLLALALRHQHTPMVARTHGQQALLTTFGYKVAVWVDEIDQSPGALRRSARTRPGRQPDRCRGNPGVVRRPGLRATAANPGRLGLGAPPSTSWHSARDRVLEVAGLLVQVSVTLGRVANEIYHLQRSEIDEVREGSRPGQVGSSTMPHKRNPSSVDLSAALSRLVRARYGGATDAAFQLHERDGTACASRAALPELFVYAGALLTRMEAVLAEGLEVREERMRTNLDLLGGLILSERVMLALAGQFGKQTAHELLHEITQASQPQGVPFREALLGQPRLRGCSAPRRSKNSSTPSATSASPRRWSTWSPATTNRRVGRQGPKAPPFPKEIPVSPST
ncbi:lyase family protein [Pseudomonas aeruginosa]|nr:lyase family protein [Pseudomonas aeruginosa]